MVTALLVLLASETATAVTWYSREGPLRVVAGGTTLGAAYGNFYNYAGSHARNAVVWRDVRPGGDGVFVDNKFYFWYTPVGGTSPTFNAGRSLQTPRTTSSAWRFTNVQTLLHSRGTQARVLAKVCEDRAWRPDPCSSTVIRTFSY